MKKLLFIAFVFLLIGGIIIWYTKFYSASKQPKSVISNPSCAVTVVSPHAGSSITNPLSVNILVDNSKPHCHWTVFEAQAGVAKLVDNTGLLLGQAPLKTTDDWTLPKPVAYNVTISYTNKPATGVVNLILTEENPSGKPNPQQLTIPLSAK